MTSREINLNRDWRFLRADAAGAESVSFDDSAWQPVGLPHTFDLPYFRTPEFYVGVGWYRKTVGLEIKPDWRALLEFAGVFQACEVFVNGRHVGGHRGGYTGFHLDITDALRPRDNLLAVRVDNHWNPQLAPRAGEHIFSGGIYRDVILHILPATHVPLHGLQVTTPEVSGDSATVRIRTEVRNTGNRRVRCFMYTRVSPLWGSRTFELEHRFDLEPGASSQIDQLGPPIARPALWHPDHPHLYEAAVDLYVDHALRHCVTTEFGIRSIEWTGDRGFFLNGEHLYLRGANAHQDHAGWGIGITQAACERDVRLIKEAGFNFVRGAHYPHHPAFAAACDRLGLLFWSEATFWGKGGFGPEGYWNASAYPTNLDDGPAFGQSCLDQLAEMIRINRNHPSVIAWSMCNEPFFTYNLDRARALLRRMVEHCRKLDPTRPAAIGGAQRGDIDRIGDIAGYNGDGARLFIEPGVPNMVSEYGAISKPHHAFEPFWGDKQIERYPWRGGEAIWCGFDYGTIAGKQGLKGIVDHQRLPKRSWHWYRQHNLGIDPPAPASNAPPVRLILETDRPEIRGTDAVEDAQIVVSAVDADGRATQTASPITLTIDKGPGEFPTGRSITFDASTDIGMNQGSAAVAFRSYHGGTSLIRATAPGLPAAVLSINTTGAPYWFERGVTPCPPRPYVPPVQSESAIAALRNAVNIALNRPCRAGSESAGHAARLANDGDVSSAWLADADDREPHWTLDLEGFYELASINLTFPSAGNWRFFVETSLDGQNWSAAINRRESVNETARRTDVFDPGLTARYLRLTFTKFPADRAGLAEVQVYGILSTR